MMAGYHALPIVENTHSSSDSPNPVAAYHDDQGNSCHRTDSDSDCSDDGHFEPTERDLLNVTSGEHRTTTYVYIYIRHIGSPVVQATNFRYSVFYSL